MKKTIINLLSFFKRNKTLLFLYVTGILLMLYSISMASYFPKNLGSYLPGSAGVLILLACIFRRQIHHILSGQMGKPLKLIIFTATGFAAISFFSMCVAISINALNVPQENRDAIIVLGAGLNGSQVSLTLALRLDKASEYLLENPQTIAVVSGGQGPEELVSEAAAMKEYLMARGIEENRILLEDASTNTLENFEFSKKILDDYFYGQPYKIIFVTNDFHSVRAGLYAKKAGLDGESLSAGTPLYMLPSYYSREYLALMWALVRP